MPEYHSITIRNAAHTLQIQIQSGQTIVSQNYSMKILANFTTLIKILIWIMFAISVAVVTLSVIVLCGVVLPIEISHGQATLLLFAFSLVTVVALLYNTIYYQVTQTHLRLKIAFLDILGGRIRLENILNIVYKVETARKKPVKKMYISYVWKGADPVIAQIAIKPKKFEKLKNELMLKNPNIVFCDEQKQENDYEIVDSEQ